MQTVRITMKKRKLRRSKKPKNSSPAPLHRRPAKALDSILALRSMGKEIWADEDPDEYVRRLRAGWE
jgi:hypothetical protein